MADSEFLFSPRLDVEGCMFEIDEHGLEISTLPVCSSFCNDDSVHLVFSNEQAISIANFILKNAKK